MGIGVFEGCIEREKERGKSKKTRMTEREEKLMEEMKQVRAMLQIITNRCTRGCGGGGDTVDQANRAVELATDRALRCLYEEKLRQMERAQARICSGQYGMCESCGAQIDPARLDVMPHAPLCERCQRENGGGIHRADYRVDRARIREVTR